MQNVHYDSKYDADSILLFGVEQHALNRDRLWKIQLHTATERRHEQQQHGNVRNDVLQ
jgi:hypothetical protein